jgi:hypothetical protein
MVVALLFGESLMALCRGFHVSILGVMLAFSGMELALVTRDQMSRTDAFAMLLTAGACMGLGNVGVGFALGLALVLCIRFGPFRVEEDAPTESQPVDTSATPAASRTLPRDSILTVR